MWLQRVVPRLVVVRTEFGIAQGRLGAGSGPSPPTNHSERPDEAAAHLTARRHGLGTVVRLLSCSALPAQMVPYEKKEHAQSTGVTSQV